jgi:hypothetical protein
MPKYTHGTGGKWFQLSFPPYKNKFACCGCGFTHSYEFKLVPTTANKKILTLWCRIRVDSRATAAVRRHKDELLPTKHCYIAAFPKRGLGPWAVIVDDVSELGAELQGAKPRKAKSGPIRSARKFRSSSARSSRRIRLTKGVRERTT